MNTMRGFTLIEMMIAILLTTLLTIGALDLFFTQSKTIKSSSQKTLNNTLGDTSFTLISRLLRHALSDSISIQYGTGQFNQDQNSNPEISNDKITIDFALPENYPIWPNDKAPYTDNWVRVSWTNDTTSSDKYRINIGVASSEAALDSAALNPLTSENHDALIANLDLWPLGANGQRLQTAQADAVGGYQFQLSSRAAKPDLGYTNPVLSEQSPILNYRTHAISGVVSPRN